MTPYQRIQDLERTLTFALEILDAYRSEIVMAHTGPYQGRIPNLVELGFCQGSIFIEQPKKIEAVLYGQEKPPW